MSSTLTKKQQKLQAFRNKQKSKKADLEIPADLPEQDPIDDAEVNEEDAAVQPKSKSSEKTKKDQLETKDGEEAGDGDKRSGEQKDKGKKRKTAWDEDEEGDEPKKKSKKDIKQRFILFVGNLSFKTTKTEIQEHFKEAVGNLPAVRLLTTKPTSASAVPKSRGIAFLELTSSTAMQAALKLHHSNLKGRTINVELTAGGGGGSEDRKRKIDERNQRVGTQREKRAEREKEEGGAEGGEGEGAAAAEGTAAEGKTRVRGGRRMKSKTQSTDSASATKRPRSDDPSAPSSGWASRQASAPRPPQGHADRGGGGGRGGSRGGDQSRDKFQRKKWQPTGANAVTVG